MLMSLYDHQDHQHNDRNFCIDILIILNASVSLRHIWSGSLIFKAVSDDRELMMKLYLVVRHNNRSALFDRHLLSTGAAE